MKLSCMNECYVSEYHSFLYVNTITKDNCGRETMFVYYKKLPDFAIIHNFFTLLNSFPQEFH